ncbi:MAG: hypothetical protein GY845_03280 [Planctomycetes bacterium]|nr:hypothetical protein [Planctomycetota bacterium]
MHYHNNPASCRVDFWKQSGKWYATEQITFIAYKGIIDDVFRESLKKAVGNYYVGMRVTCLEPYHEHSHPISIIWEGTSNE